MEGTRVWACTSPVSSSTSGIARALPRRQFGASTVLSYGLRRSRAEDSTRESQFRRLRRCQRQFKINVLIVVKARLTRALHTGKGVAGRAGGEQARRSGGWPSSDAAGWRVHPLMYAPREEGTRQGASVQDRLPFHFVAFLHLD